MMLNKIKLFNIIYATCNIHYLIQFFFSRIILYVDIILGNEIKFFSRVTCISVRSSYKIKNILNNRSGKENLEYKETEKEENIDEEEKNN